MKTSPKIVLILIASVAACPGLLAQTAAAPAADKPKPDVDVVHLSPFEVTANADVGYQATDTLAGTRIRTNLSDVASSIQVITKEFMQDIGATDSGTLLQYTTNAEVSGTRGTYAGLGNNTSVNETSLLRDPEIGNRVRGLAAADNTRDYFVTDIPWDSFDVDRIDIQRGPNSILFGLGSPAGIVNATTHAAEFRNFGDFEFRTGSYGSARSSLDVNQQIIDDVLAIRLDGLWNDQKYEQNQAYQNDKRVYGTIRFDPKLFRDPSFHTSIKVKFENGDIKADRPRIVPPADSLSPWFRPVNNSSLDGGTGKLLLNTAYGVTAQPQTLNPWLTAGIANQQQPLWLVDGSTNELYRITGGYINNGFLNNNGTFRGVGNSAIGQVYSDQFYGLTSLTQFANNAKAPGYQFGQYRQESLLDSSVFDFYNNLIDGPTASQFEKWNAYNIDVQQTAFDDRLGIDLSYDRQKYKRGGQSLMNNPTLTIDILQNFQDLTPNPNVGRPYVQAGPGSGTDYQSDRKYLRASVFGEVRASDFFAKGSFLEKLLGTNRFNGIYSKEDYATQNHTWQENANSREWDGYWNVNDGSSNNINNRAPTMAIYLGPSISGMSSSAGANIPGITAPVSFTAGNVYQFNSAWKNLPGVNPSDPWVVPASLATIFPAAGAPAGGYTQASNPANYVGWNANVADNLIVDNMDTNPALTTVAQKTLRETKSWAGSWQGFLWNGAIVPTLGWRYDEVQNEAATAVPVTANRGELNFNTSGAFSTQPFVLPNGIAGINKNQSFSIFKDHSTAGGVVVHLNKFFEKNGEPGSDRLPLNLTVSFDKSSNFQVTDTRHDFFGNVISNPTGATKEWSVLLSTKDGKYSLRAVKYDTSIANGSAALDMTGLAGAIVQGLKFRNVFLYQMSNYTWASREDGYGTTLSPGNRHFWTPAYINSTGRPVADLNGAGGSTAGATLETQAQADAHRDAAIDAWNSIQTTLAATNFFGAWNFTPTTLSALTNRATYMQTLGPNTEHAAPGSSIIVPVQNNATYVPDPSTLASCTATAPGGLTVTADSKSKGYEYEFTANPLPNWRIAFNAAETTAVQDNVGGAQLDAFVSYMDTQMAGVAGDMRQFNGNYVAGNEVRQNYANWRGSYTLLKLQEGADVSELRKWRFNLITNYTFDHGILKNVGVGAGYRWQDKVVIGYPVIPGSNNQASFDLSKPYYGPSEGYLDLWASYEHKVTKKIGWRIQANVTNVGKKDRLIPISVEPDGETWASARIAPVQEWYVTNTFMF